jgi:hypothetical protein
MVPPTLQYQVTPFSVEACAVFQNAFDEAFKHESQSSASDNSDFASLHLHRTFLMTSAWIMP